VATTTQHLVHCDCGSNPDGVTIWARCVFWEHTFLNYDSASGALVGAQGTTFQGNRAAGGGGDIYGDKQARMHVFGAKLLKASAAGGGSLAMWENSIVTLNYTVIADATAQRSSGGCVVLGDNATLILTRSLATGCSSPAAYGGAIAADGRSHVMLLGSNITNSTAGTTQNVITASGGGLDADGNATITLHDAVLAGNTAKWGGGLAIGGNASLQMLGTTVITRNHAWKYGGGVMTESDAVLGDDLSTFAFNNSAITSADVHVVARTIKVVGTNSSIDKFITSVDSQGGMLYVTLNVSGPHGVPSDDALTMSLVDTHNTTRFTQAVQSQRNNKSTMDVAVRIRQPPGGADTVSVSAVVIFDSE